MSRDHVSRKLPTIRLQLVLVVNVVLLLFVFGFLTYDYFREVDDQLHEKHIALQEEAKTLLPGVLHLQSLGNETVQEYVDDVCSRMDNLDSPRHHIAVELDGELLQAHAHHRQSEALVSAMQLASETKRKRIRVSGHDLVVGVQSSGNATVFVSEDVSNVRLQILADETRRMLWLVLAGLIAVGIVNIVLVRLVSQPLSKLVIKVREVSEGDFSTELGSFGSSELNFLAREINKMNDALKASEHERKLRLKKAHRIQQNLLPRNYRDISGLEVGRLYCPAEDVGGDFYDILPCGSGRWLFCLADATDHGVPAAMSAAMLKTLLLQAAEQSDQPDMILAEMNGKFMEVHPYGYFASIILVRIDLDERKLVYANAGHSPAWVLQPEGDSVDLPATGTLLGIEGCSKWPSKILEFSIGSRLVLSTDGITETFDDNGKAYGRFRLLEKLLECRSKTVNQAIVDVSADVDNFRGLQAQTDDVTLLVIDRVNQGSHPSSSANDAAKTVHTTETADSELQ